MPKPSPFIDPQWMLFTSPGCDAPAHRADIVQDVYLMCTLPGYRPPDRVLRCGCSMTTIPLPPSMATRSEAEGRQ